MDRKRGTQFESLMSLLLKGRYKTKVRRIINLGNVGEFFHNSPYARCRNGQ